MRPVSARSTAPYQTLLFFSSRTLPTSVAFSATNAAPSYTFISDPVLVIRPSGKMTTG
jgi:hypothetical protein